MKVVSIIFVFVFILTAATSFAQFPWTKDQDNNPVLVPGEPGTWNDVSEYPFSVLFHEGTYRLWIGGYDGITVSFGYFSSPDGINWTPYEANPILHPGTAGSWDDNHLANPNVIFNNNLYKMWYAASDGNNYRIGYATSPDGLIWTKYEGNPVMDLGPEGSWDDSAVYDPCVYFDGATYHMWYSGGNGSVIRIGYASSPDGTTWTKNEDNPVLEKGSVPSWDYRSVMAPSVIFDGMTYHMWYSGTVESSGWHYRTGYATSGDGLTWTKHEGNPVLTPDDGSWDSQWVGYVHVLRDDINGLYKMWYGGGADDEVAKIGYATAPIFDALEEFASQRNPRDFNLNQNYPNPFNPVTTISYELPMSTDVNLSIYNLLGQKVATLVDKKQAAGKYQARWDATGFASGIYICRLEANGQREKALLTKKLLLLK
jgi:predicted GH43/DUF377 family glycosyl hydrolase